MGGFILRSTTEYLLLWEQRINERAKSGMSVSEWCKNNEISKSQFHYWNNKISKKQKPDTEIAFAEITPILLNEEESIKNSAKPDDFEIFFKYKGNSSKQFQSDLFSRTNESSAESMIHYIADEAEHIYIAYTEFLTIPKFLKNIL
jgi:hypothetical protein